MDLIDVFKTFHPNEEYTIFSSAYGSSSRIDHILGQIKPLQFKKIEIVSGVFSDHNTMRLRYQLQEKNCKKHKLMDFIDTKWLLNNEEVTEEMRRETQKILRTSYNETSMNENLCGSQQMQS